MAQKKRGKSRRAQRPRPPGSRPGLADASSNGRKESAPELNGDLADPLADAAAELDEREAALERELSPLADPSTEADGYPATEADAYPATDAEADADADADEVVEPDEENLDEAPGALDHAAPGAEIAEAQIALGAFEASELEVPPAPGDDQDPLATDEDQVPPALDADEGAELSAPDEDGDPEPGEALAVPPPARARRQASPEIVEEEDEDDVRSPATRSGAPRQNAIVRLAHFVQGSWRELQRVQWPDRRQVMQATGVVIGFVIVAGVFLGVSDWLAGKLVNWILG